MQALGDPVQAGGRAGQVNQPGGCWIRWETTPVAKQVVKATPRATPRMAATRSSWRGLGKAPYRNGPTRARSGQGEFIHGVQSGEPTSSSGPHIVDHHAGAAGDGVGVVHADPGPGEPGSGPAVDLEADPLAAPRVPGG